MSYIPPRVNYTRRARVRCPTRWELHYNRCPGLRCANGTCCTTRGRRYYVGGPCQGDLRPSREAIAGLYPTGPSGPVPPMKAGRTACRVIAWEQSPFAAGAHEHIAPSRLSRVIPGCDSPRRSRIGGGPLCPAACDHRAVHYPAVEHIPQVPRRRAKHAPGALKEPQVRHTPSVASRVRGRASERVAIP